MTDFTRRQLMLGVAAMAIAPAALANGQRTPNAQMLTMTNGEWWAGEPTWQWYVNGKPIPGATGKVLTYVPDELMHEGANYVTVRWTVVNDDI